MLAARRYRIVLNRRFVRALSRPAWQRRKLIVLQSRPTRSLVAKFPQRSVVACSAQISCWRGTTLQRGHGRGCVQTFDAWCRGTQSASEHNRSYVSSVDLPSDSLRKNLAWCGLHGGPRKTTKLPNLGVGACAGMCAWVVVYWYLWKRYRLCLLFNLLPGLKVKLSWRCSTCLECNTQYCMLLLYARIIVRALAIIVWAWLKKDNLYADFVIWHFSNVLK